MVAAMPYPSGQGTQALVGELARGLSRHGHLVNLICYHHGAFSRDEPFPVHRIKRVPLYRRMRSGPDAVKPVLDMLLARRTIEVVREFDCQLIHAHNYEGALAGWLAAKTCRVPLVYHAHNLMEDELPRYFESGLFARLAAKAGWGLDRTVPRLASRVIALHDRIAAALEACGVSARKIQVIEPGIETDFWRVEPGQQVSEPLVAYTGNLDNYQDLPTLFKAMPMVVAEASQAQLLVATPNDPHDAWRLAARHGAGSLIDVAVTLDALDTRQVMRRARLVVSPRSSWSGFPVKNLNAAAAGLPIVACQWSAFGVEDQKTGLVVPNRDPRALADAILDLIKNPDLARSMGRAGQRLVNERFSLERMVTQVEEVWSSLL